MLLLLWSLVVTCLGTLSAYSLLLEVLVDRGHTAPGHVESLAKLAWLLLCALLQGNLPGARVCFLFLRDFVSCRLNLALALWSSKHVLLHLADTRNYGFEKGLRTNEVVPVLAHYKNSLLSTYPSALCKCLPSPDTAKYRCLHDYTRIG
jgi:hypothetical protein